MRNRIEMRTVAAIAAMIVTGTMTVGRAQAATATVNVPVNLAVSAPTCTVTNGTNTIALPSASSQNLTLSQYLSGNNITTAGQVSSLWVTSAAFNQTATITCTAPTTILSFVVQPGTSATLNGTATGQQYLVDLATTPAKAGGGNLYMSFEQVSINGGAAGASYTNSSGVVQPYATVFNTSGSANTATVVWRPAFYVPSASSSSVIGNPTGGIYSGSAEIVVTY